MRRLPATLVLIACGAPGDTALRVRADFETGVAPEQLRFSGESDGVIAFGPELRPDLPTGEPLRSGDALLVLLPDRLASHDVTCRVEGLGAGEVLIAIGSGVARVEAGAEVECRAVLQAVRQEPPDAGAPACSGCLDDKGTCKPGSDNHLCGWGGGRCAECGHETSCLAGQCV
jgi:hypothetical protein